MYIGRFAPSPTGPLHMGSLVAALASFLDARSHDGKWLLRMENLDPPREMEGAQKLIPEQLADHGLEWDGEIVYQGQRLETYSEFLDQIKAGGKLFACNCARKQIKKSGGIYNGHCRDRNLDFAGDVAVRVLLDQDISWQDLIQGHQLFSPEQLMGDFILKRRDGLFSYQLAVAVDDALQGITRVIRGADLLDSTARQIYVHELLELNSPEYGHVPMVENDIGQKLSKQTHAEALESSAVSANLVKALEILGQSPPADLLKSSSHQILDWAIEHWQLDSVPSGPVQLC